MWNYWFSVRVHLPPEMTSELWRNNQGKIIFDNLLDVFVGFYYKGTWYTGEFKDVLDGNGEWVDDVKFWTHIPTRRTINEIPEDD